MASSFIRDLPGDLRRIAEVAGLEAAVKIGRAFRGTYLYIHGLDQLQRLLRDEEIRRAYEMGVGIKNLSVRHSLSERQIKRILGEPASMELSNILQRLISDSPCYTDSDEQS